MASLQGHLLVASPRLGDPNFFRAVVLIIRHSAQGAFGVVLNRPGNTRLRDAWDNISQVPCETDAFIYHGGPCPGPLMAVHCDASLAESHVLEGAYFSTAKDELESLASNAQAKARFYVGYAGWSAEQLEDELAEGAWFTTPAKLDHLFWPDDSLWQTLSSDLASIAKIAGLRIKHTPPDPRWN